MGGLGSGSWPGRRSKATVETYHSVDINQWHRLGYLHRDFPWVWIRAGRVTASLSVRTEPESIDLTYRCRAQADVERPEVQQHVQITWTLCQYGGRRPWFECACGRRAAKLYVAHPVRAHLS